MKIGNKLIIVCSGLLFLSFTSLSNAKNISMYEQPATNAKSVGSLDSEYGIITVFTPKGSEWTKVADPRNGNVGWIRNSELGNNSFNFKVITKDNDNRKYHIYQYGNTTSQTPTQIENEIKAMQLRQQAIQRDMQHMINDMFSMFYYPSPMIVPVFVTPEQHNAKPPTSTPAKKAQAMQTSTSTASDHPKH